MGAAGYGMVSPGIFRMPGPLQRGLYSGGASDVDPTAALIGNALQSFGSVRAGRQAEADRQDALARRDASEAAMANWRDLQSGIALANAGLTTRPPDAPAATPVGAPTKTVPGAPSMPDLGGPAAGVDPSRVGGVAAPTATTPTVQPSSAPSQPVSPLETVGGVSLYRAGPSGKDRQTMAVGHAMAQQLFGHDVDDNTALGIGAHPEAFASWQRFTETPREKPTPVAEGTGIWDPNTQTVRPSGFVPPQFAHPKPTPAQSTNAEFGAQALAAWTRLDHTRQQNPGVDDEVGRILASPAFVQALPGFKSSADMVTALQKAGASPAAQDYMREKWAFMNPVVRTRYPGSRMSGAMMQQLAPEFLPGLDTEGNTQIRTNEIQSILSAQGEAGYDVNPDIWNAAAKRHGVSNVDLQAALAGGGSDSRLNAIRSRY